MSSFEFKLKIWINQNVPPRYRLRAPTAGGSTVDTDRPGSSAGGTKGPRWSIPLQAKHHATSPDLDGTESVAIDIPDPRADGKGCH
jgi:hypothetical protein